MMPAGYVEHYMARAAEAAPWPPIHWTPMHGTSEVAWRLDVTGNTAYGHEVNYPALTEAH